MIVSILSFVVMFIVFYGIGAGVLRLMGLLFGYREYGIYEHTMAGIVACTVYAQFFSIIYKVGMAAFVILGIITFVCYVFCGAEILESFRSLSGKTGDKHIKQICAVMIDVGIIILASYIASRPVLGFDIENYHEASVRWIEEYGVVKGLGNLATWFAYNSSFHSLQALFSFSWLNGISMHSMNAFMWMYMLSFCVNTSFVFDDRPFGLSDVLRILFARIMFASLTMGINESMAGPMTDFMPRCLIGYIFIRWCQLNEKKEKEQSPYGLLCVLALFSATVKLSAAPVFIFAIAPIILMISKRRYADIFKFGRVCLAVVCPFLIRNYLISGYLLYPMAGIDIFNPDWKMNKAVAIADSTAIRVFARTEWDEGRFSHISEGFGTWFPVWVKGNYAFYAIPVIACLFISAVLLYMAVYRRLKKADAVYDGIIYVASAVCFLYWLLSAPSIRFGIVWIYILPAVCIYGYADIFILDRDNKIEKRINMKDNGIWRYPVASFLLLLMCGIHLYLLGIEQGYGNKLIPEEYYHSYNDEYVYDVDGVKFYYTVADEGEAGSSDGYEGMTGYYGFPGSHYLGYLKKMELRGEDLGDGFRVKNEYRSIPYGTNGELFTEEFFDVLKLSRYYRKTGDILKK